MVQRLRTSIPSVSLPRSLAVPRSELGGGGVALENAFALTAEQRACFERDGFVVLQDVVPAEVRVGLREVLAEAVDVLAHRWAREGRIRDVCEVLPLETRYGALCRQLVERVPVDWRRLLVSRPVYGLWQRPELLGRVRSLFGDGEVFAHGMWGGQPLEPGNPLQAVSWHRDADVYGWRGLDMKVVSVGVPLVPVDERSGCVQFVPGSHNFHYHYRHRPRGVERAGSPASALNGRGPYSAVLEPGDAVFFSDRVLHQSLDNVADHVRWSMEIRFCDRAAEAAGDDLPGYRCFSSADSPGVESYETWAARHDEAVDPSNDPKGRFCRGMRADLDAKLSRGTVDAILNSGAPNR